MAQPVTRDAVADTIAALTAKRDLLRSLNVDTTDIDAKLSDWEAITAPPAAVEPPAVVEPEKKETPDVEKKSEPTPPETATPTAPETAAAKPVKAAPAKAPGHKPAAAAKDADGGPGHTS